MANFILYFLATYGAIGLVLHVRNVLVTKEPELIELKPEDVKTNGGCYSRYSRN